MSKEQKPAGANLIERFRNQHVGLRWGIAAFVALLMWLLLTAI